jgi:hypothetical protein
MNGRKRDNVGVARAATGAWRRRPAFASDWSMLWEQSNKLRRDMPEGAFVVERGGPRRQGSRRARGAGPSVTGAGGNGCRLDHKAKLEE